MLFKLQFLWDEEKTRRLFKTHLYLFLIGAGVAFLYALLIAAKNSYAGVLISIPLIIFISCILNIIFLNKSKPGFRFFLFTLETQLAVSVFMAFSGGFLGIVSFAPYMLLLFAVFELGADTALILGCATFFSFIFIFLYQVLKTPTLNNVATFIYYCGSYILIVLIEHNIGNEISIQVEAKKKLEEVDNLKNQFIILASHYFRTPLTVIKLCIQDIGHKTDNLEEENDIHRINTSLFTLEKIIEKMLIISNIEKGYLKLHTQAINLNSFIKEIVKEVDTIASTYHIKINFQSSVADTFTLNLDKEKFKDALENILDNAIKYNKTEGIVDINISIKDNKLYLRIADTGKGMNNKQLDTLFTPFNRGDISNALDMNVPGIGLSLYIAKLIINSHGGSIEAESKENMGSTFTITFKI